MISRFVQDKVTIKTIAVNIEEGKLERALDLVKRLHLEKSYDIVMALADRHRDLVERIEKVKEWKFAGDDGTGSSSDEEDTKTHELNSYSGRQITPEVNDKRIWEGGDDGRRVRFRVTK